MRRRHPKDRGVSLDKILNELIKTGVLSKEQEAKATKQVEDFKKERGQNGRDQTGK